MIVRKEPEPCDVRADLIARGLIRVPEQGAKHMVRKRRGLTLDDKAKLIAARLAEEELRKIEAEREGTDEDRRPHAGHPKYSFVDG